jgi:hypothetical protein
MSSWIPWIRGAQSPPASPRARDDASDPPSPAAAAPSSSLANFEQQRMLATYEAKLKAKEAELAAKHAKELADNAAKHAQELADAAVRHEQEMAAAAEQREAAAAEHHTYGLPPDLVERLRPHLAALQDKMDDGFGFWLKYQERLSKLQKTIVVGTQGTMGWRTDVTETVAIGVDDPVPASMLPKSIAAAWDWSARGTQAQLNILQEIVAIIRELGLDPSKIEAKVQRRQDATTYLSNKKQKTDHVRSHGCECAEGDCTAGSRPGRVCTCTSNGLGCGEHCKCTRGKDRLNLGRDKCSNVHNAPIFGSRPVAAIDVSRAAAAASAWPVWKPSHQNIPSEALEMGMRSYLAQQQQQQLQQQQPVAVAVASSEMQLDSRLLALHNLPPPPSAAPGAVRQRTYVPLSPAASSHIAAAAAYNPASVRPPVPARAPAPPSSGGVPGCCQCMVKAGNCAGACPCSFAQLMCTNNCRCSRNPKSKCMNPVQPGDDEGSDGDEAMRAAPRHA